MPQSAETIFRDFTTDGIPASGAHEPRKVEIREWGTWLEGFANAISAGGGYVFPDKATIDIVSSPPQHSMGWVVSDPTPGNNGVYRKMTSGASWARVADLPFSFIRASDAGDGTANAIQATTSIPIPSSDGAALIALNIFEDNTASPVTVSFNSATPLTIKTNSGNDVSAGGLSAGMIVAGYKSGSTFRLLTDQVDAAIVAAAEAAADRAEDAANSVDAATFANGYIKVTDAAFAAVGDGTTDTTTAVSNAVAAALAAGAILYWPAGDYLTTASIPNFHDVKHEGLGRVLRGSDVWYIEPGAEQGNTIFVSPSGGDVNDGLSASQPIATIAKLRLILRAHSPLKGLWTARLAASDQYDFGITFDGIISERPFVVRGPGLSQLAGQAIGFSLGGLSGTFQVGETVTSASGAAATITQLITRAGAQLGLTVSHVSGTFANGNTLTGGTSGATAVLDSLQIIPLALVGHPSTQNGSGWRFSGCDAVVQDVKFRNFNSSVSAFALAVVDGGKLAAINPHVDTASRGIAGFDNTIFSVVGGIIENCATEGIISLFGSKHTIGSQSGGYAAGPVIRNNDVGFSAREASSGHSYALHIGNAFGMDIQANGRVNADLASCKRNTVAVRANDANFLSACQFNTGTVDANGMNIRYTGYAVDSLRWSRANTPRIPVRDLNEATAPANTSENTIKTFTLDKDEYLAVAGSIYLGKKVLVRVMGNIVGTAGTKTLRVRLAGTAMSALVLTSGTAGRFTFEAEVFITNRSVQTTYGTVVSDTGTQQGRAGTTVDLGDGTDKDITFSVQKGAAGDTVVVQRFEIECDG